MDFSITGDSAVLRFFANYKIAGVLNDWHRWNWFDFWTFCVGINVWISAFLCMMGIGPDFFVHSEEFPSLAEGLWEEEQGMALRLALTFFRSWRTEICDGLDSIRMDGALCLRPSWMSLTDRTRNWRLIVAVVVVGTNCGYG